MPINASSKEKPVWNSGSRGVASDRVISSTVGIGSTPRPKVGSGSTLRSVVSLRNPNLQTLSPEVRRVVEGSGEHTRVSRQVAKSVTAKTAPKSIVSKPVVQRNAESPVVPSDMGSSHSTVTDSTPRDTSVTPRAKAYSEEDVRDIVRTALQLKEEQRKAEQERSLAEESADRAIKQKAKLTVKEAVNLNFEHKAALAERDRHVVADKFGLKVESNDETLVRQARDFVEFLDTIPNAAQRATIKQNFLNTAFGDRSSSEYQTLIEAINNFEKTSSLLRDHAQDFMNYLDTLPTALARDNAMEDKIENMRRQSPTEARKFLLFLEQLQPTMQSKVVESVEQQPTEQEFFEQEMASSAEDLARESKQHLDLLSRQELSIKAQNDKLEKYKDLLKTADADKRAKLESLIAKTEKQLDEMKVAFQEAVDKSAAKLEQHMQEHANVVEQYGQAMKEAEMSAARAVAPQVAREKAAQEIQKQQEDLQRQREQFQRDKDEHEKQLKAAQDELHRKTQELEQQRFAINSGMNTPRQPATPRSTVVESGYGLSTPRERTGHILHYSREQILAKMGNLEMEGGWTKDKRTLFEKTFAAYHESFSLSESLEKGLNKAIEQERQKLFKELGSLPAEQKQNAPQIEQLQQLQARNYANFPTLQAFGQQLQELQTIQTEVATYPWSLVGDEFVNLPEQINAIRETSEKLLSQVHKIPDEPRGLMPVSDELSRQSSQVSVNDKPIDISQESLKPKSWRDKLREAATTAAKKTQDTFKWIAQSLPKGSGEPIDHDADSSSNSDDRDDYSRMETTPHTVVHEAADDDVIRDEAAHVAQEHEDQDHEDASTLTDHINDWGWGGH